MDADCNTDSMPMLTMRIADDLDEGLEALAWATRSTKSDLLRRAAAALLDAELSGEDLEAFRAARPLASAPARPRSSESPPPVRIARPGKGNAIGRRWRDSNPR